MLLCETRRRTAEGLRSRIRARGAHHQRTCCARL